VLPGLHRLHAAVVLVCLFLAAAPAQAKELNTIQTEPGSGIEIEVSCDFDRPPPSGAVPLHVTVHNNSNREGTWRFVADDDAYSGYKLPCSLNVTVGAGQTRTAPMVSAFSLYGSYRGDNVYVTGPGVRMRTAAYLGRAGNGGENCQFLAMSRELSARSWESLQKNVQARKCNLNAIQFDAPDLAADWRGYSGIEWLAFSASEWKQLAPDVRSGIRQWVAQGGHLVVAARDATELD